MTKIEKFVLIGWAVIIVVLLIGIFQGVWRLYRLRSVRSTTTQVSRGNKAWYLMTRKERKDYAYAQPEPPKQVQVARPLRRIEEKSSNG